MSVAKRARIEPENDVDVDIDIDRLCYMAMGDYTSYQRLCDILPSELSWGHVSMTHLLEYILVECNGFNADRLTDILISHTHFVFASLELYFLQLMLDFARNRHTVKRFLEMEIFDGEHNVPERRPRWHRLGLYDDPDCVVLLNRLKLPVEVNFEEVETYNVSVDDRRRLFDGMTEAAFDNRLKIHCVTSCAELFADKTAYNPFYLIISAARIPMAGYQSVWPRLRSVLSPNEAEKTTRLLVREAALMIRRLAGYTLLKDIHQKEFIVCEKKTAVVLDYLYSWRRLNHIVVWQTATTLQFVALAVVKQALPIHVLHQIIDLVWPEHLEHSQVNFAAQIAALQVATDSANANAKTFARIN